MRGHLGIPANELLLCSRSISFYYVICFCTLSKVLRLPPVSIRLWSTFSKFTSCSSLIDTMLIWR